MKEFGFFGKTVRRIEGIRAPFVLWVGAFFGITFARNILESFLEQPHELIRFEWFFVHYPLAGISLVLAYALVLIFLAKERIQKIGKVLVAVWLIVLVAPVLDFMISGGQGYGLTYVYGNLEALMKYFFSFFGEFRGFGVTPGQRLEIATGMLLGFLYVANKTGKYWKGVLGGFLIYAITFVFSAMPSVLVMALFLNPGLNIRHYPETFFWVGDALTVLFFFLIIAELAALFWICEKEKFRLVLKSLLPLKALHYLLMVLFGAIVGLSLHAGEVRGTELAVLCVAGFFGFQAARGINDFADKKIDRISNTGRVLANGLNGEEYKALIVVWFLIALYGTVIAGIVPAILFLASFGVAAAYSLPPLRLRKFFLSGNLLLALISVNAFFSGYFVQGGESFLEVPVNFPLFILIYVVISFNVKDLKDFEGDKAGGVKTIPVLFGKEKGRKIIAVLILASYLLSSFMLGKEILLIPGILFGFAGFFLVLKKFNENAVIGLYLAYAALVGYVFIV